MGNRAIVLFAEHKMKKRDRHIGVYVHWNGGSESIYAFVKALACYRLSQFEGGAHGAFLGAGSLSLRFAQMVGNFFSEGGASFGTCCIEANPGVPLKCGVDTDNGVYVVLPDFSIQRVGEEMNGASRYMDDEERLAEFKAVLRSDYWRGEESMLDAIRKSNDRAFLRKYTSDGAEEFMEFREALLPVEREFDLAAELAIIESEEIAEACPVPVEPPVLGGLAMRL